MTDYAPMYSTHGHGRKTHIAGVVKNSYGSLCGVEQMHPDLLWTIGEDYYSVEEQFLIDPDEHGCRRCRRIYQQSTAALAAPERNEGDG